MKSSGITESLISSIMNKSETPGKAAIPVSQFEIHVAKILKDNSYDFLEVIKNPGVNCKVLSQLMLQNKGFIVSHSNTQRLFNSFSTIETIMSIPAISVPSNDICLV